MIRRFLTVLLTLVAGGVAALVARRDLLYVGADASPVRISDWREIAVLWAAAVLLVWLSPRPVGGARWRRVAFWATLAAIAGIAAFAAWHPGRPEKMSLDGAGPAAAAPRRTLVVAIDALTWDRLLPLARRGELPHFARLMREGSYGALHSQRTFRRSVGREGYWSPVVWTSIATGVGPGEHGVTDFSLLDAEGGQTLAAAYHRRAPAFWNLFSAFGRRVGVVGWWATWPAEAVDGFMVSSGIGLRGRRTPAGHAGEVEIQDRFDSGLTHPAELKEELETKVHSPTDTTRFIDERLFPISSYPLVGERERGTLESVIWQDRYYNNVARYLLGRERFDVFAVYFEGVDLVGHLFWRYRDDPQSLFGVRVPRGFEEQAKIVDRYYAVADGWLGGLLELAGDEATIVVCSDHGFRSDPEHEQKADHSGFGVLLVRGPGIRRGHDLDLSLRGAYQRLLRGPATVLDVLPTLLYLHGLPISDELEGRVLYSLFARSYLRANPEIRVPGYGDFATTRSVEMELPPEQREEYLERLRSLGYID